MPVSLVRTNMDWVTQVSGREYFLTNMPRTRESERDNFHSSGLTDGCSQRYIRGGRNGLHMYLLFSHFVDSSLTVGFSKCTSLCFKIDLNCTYMFYVVLSLFFPFCVVYMYVHLLALLWNFWTTSEWPMSGLAKALDESFEHFEPHTRRPYPLWSWFGNALTWVKWWHYERKWLLGGG